MWQRSKLPQRFAVSSVSDIHSVPARSNTNGDFYVPHPYLEIYKQSYLYTGQMTWDKLHPKLKSIQDLSCFKRQFKAFIKANGHVSDVKYVLYCDVFTHTFVFLLIDTSLILF